MRSRVEGLKKGDEDGVGADARKWAAHAVVAGPLVRVGAPRRGCLTVACDASPTTAGAAPLLTSPTHPNNLRHAQQHASSANRTTMQAVRGCSAQDRSAVLCFLTVARLQVWPASNAQLPNTCCHTVQSEKQLQACSSSRVQGGGRPIDWQLFCCSWAAVAPSLARQLCHGCSAMISTPQNTRQLSCVLHNGLSQQQQPANSLVKRLHQLKRAATAVCLQTTWFNR